MGVMAMKGKWHIGQRHRRRRGDRLSRRDAARRFEMGCGARSRPDEELRPWRLQHRRRARRAADQCSRRPIHGANTTRALRAQRNSRAWSQHSSKENQRWPRPLLYIDLRTCDASYWSDLERSWSRNSQILLSDHIPNPREKPAADRTAMGCLGARMSGVGKSTCSGRTNLGRLFATGSNAKNKRPANALQRRQPTGVRDEQLVTSRAKPRRIKRANCRCRT